MEEQEERLEGLVELRKEIQSQEEGEEEESLLLEQMGLAFLELLGVGVEEGMYWSSLVEGEEVKDFLQEEEGEVKQKMDQSEEYYYYY